ncbi:hypothetical protein [Pseudomonas sp. RGM2987]|uniref:hypothetical protein n=1 Tax=Pseudomonas sp. RGM2987 TaxID=2930090 RepID=UPI001FD6AB85|nr:hypothetical protein [Pseudomonas sp. RGM2987]MCJ8207489.1 hypothetical protein [Pseudomonas sp. RGM2987]
MVLAALGGCSGPAWKVSSETDAITRKSSAMVTTGSYKAGSSPFADPTKMYPVVRMAEGDVYVGLVSTHESRNPVLSAQVWIDRNEAWTISSQETPIFFALPSGRLLLGLDPELSKQAGDRGLNVYKLMGGYTVTGGAKARAILHQMLAGQILKYRTFGIDQTPSAIYEVVLDESFSQSLKAAGIDPTTL